MAKRDDVEPTLKKVKCYITNCNSFFWPWRSWKNHERIMENHGKIMEFESGKLLGTLTITIETETRKFVFSFHCRRIHLLELVQSVPNPLPLPSLPPTKHSTRKNHQTSRVQQNGLALTQKRVVLPTGRKY